MSGPDLQHGVMWSTCTSRQSLARSMPSYASKTKRSATSLVVQRSYMQHGRTVREVAERFMLLANDDMDMARDWRDGQVDHITPCCMYDLRGRQAGAAHVSRAPAPRARSASGRSRAPQACRGRGRCMPSTAAPQRLTDSTRLSQAARRRACAARVRRCSSTRWSWRGRGWRPTPAAGARRAHTRACCTVCRRPRAWRACPVRPRAARHMPARHVHVLARRCERMRRIGVCPVPGGRAWRAHQPCARARCDRWSSWVCATCAATGGLPGPHNVYFFY